MGEINSKGKITYVVANNYQTFIVSQYVEFDIEP